MQFLLQYYCCIECISYIYEVRAQHGLDVLLAKMFYGLQYNFCCNITAALNVGPISYIYEVRAQHGLDVLLTMVVQSKIILNTTIPQH